MSAPVALYHRIDGPPDGPALVLGGSLGATLEMWEPQLSKLAQTQRVIRFDHRGHGGSPVLPGPYAIDDLGRDVLALLDQLGLERVSYCGLSIGGMVGQWLAINAPERVHRLILIGTSANLPPASGWHERADSVRRAGSPEVVADAVLGRWFTPEFAAAQPELVARYRAMIAGSSAEGYAGCCEAIASLDLRGGLPGVTAPTLVIAGEQDPSIAPEHGRAIAAAIPGARFELLSPAAHLASVERAAEVTDLIIDHLATPLSASPATPLSASVGDPAYQAGMAVRREVLGDAHVDRAIQRTTDLTAPFQEFITRYAWGSVWTREGLERSTRSAITLAVLAALGRENEIELHVRGALRNGLTPAQIGEVLLHTAVYAGVPAANAAMAIAQRVMAEQNDVPEEQDDVPAGQ